MAFPREREDENEDSYLPFEEYLFLCIFSEKKVISLCILLIVIYDFPSMRTLRKRENLFYWQISPLLTRSFNLHIYIYIHLAKISFKY